VSDTVAGNDAGDGGFGAGSPVSAGAPALEADGDLEVKARRLDAAAAVVPYVLLLVSVVLAMLEPGQSAAQRAVTLGLSALAAAWMLWMLTLHPAWMRRQAPMAVYFIGLLALIAVLTSRTMLFGFFAFSGYLHAWSLLRGRWRLAGVAANALLSTVWMLEDLPRTPLMVVVYLAVVAIVVALVATFSQIGEVTMSQSLQRKRVIAELADANGKLEAAMAENAALHAQLVAGAREAGVRDERERMAREIHDTLAQGLTGIVTQIQAAEQASGRPADWRRHLDNAVRLARESLSEARRSVHVQGPEPLEHKGLPEALASVAQRWSSVNGVPTEVVTTGMARPLHADVEITLLRTAQESLANVAKHAAASRVGLTLSYMEDLVTLDVRDDGVGFDPAAVREGQRDGTRHADGGFGLIAMRQRVSRLAGELEIESEPGGGTAIWACVPAIPKEATDV
jgi:signal transduction histidine kinase